MASKQQLNIIIAGDAGQLSQAIQDAVNGMNQMEQKAEKSSKEVAGSFEQMSGKVKVAAGAAGAAAGAAFGVGVTGALDAEQVNNRLEAQLGISEKRAKSLGKVAGDLWTGAWGESLAETSEAVGAVVSSVEGMRGATTAHIEAITVKALDLASTFDVDVAEAVTSVGVLINSGLARDSAQAFDLITAAAQRVPASLRETVITEMDEFADEFSQLGLSGADAFSTFIAGAEKGEVGITAAGDAIKEFTLRATDMSSTSVDAYKAIGLDAEDMADRLLKGGSTARKATKEIADGLLAIESPSERANTAIMLFGTPLEDLNVGDIPKFLEGLSGTSTAMDGFADASDRMGDSANKSAKVAITAFQRQLQKLAIDVIGNNVIPALASMGPAAEAASAWMGAAFGDARSGIRGFARDNRREIRSVMRVFEDVGDVAHKVFRTVIAPAFRFGRDVAKRVLPGIVTMFEGLGRGIKGVVDIISGVLSGDFGKAFGGLKGIVSGAVKMALGAFRAVTSPIREVADRVGGAAVRGLRDGLGGIVGTVNRALIGAGRKVVDWVSNFAKAGARLASSLVKGLLGGLTGLPGKIAGKLKGVAGGALSAAGSFFGVGDGVGKKMTPPAPSGGSGSLMGANAALGPIAGIGASFGLSVSSGKRASGGKTSSGGISYHGSGEAIDLAGPPAGMMATFRALKSRMGGRLAELIYTPGGAGIKDGRAHTYTGAVAAQHYDHVHAALDLGRPGPGIGDGDGVQGAFQRAIRETKAGPKASLALMMAGIVESGMRNLPHGDRDSKGALQVRVGIHGEELAMDPYRSAMAFLTRGFTGRGGAIALAPKFATAGQVAQAVQGSAFPARYDQVRARALALLGGAGKTKSSASSSGGGSGGGGSSVSRSEQQEKAGSLLVNKLVEKYGKGPQGFANLARGASKLGTQIEDADTRYGLVERRQGQSEEDLGTAEGRAARMSELGELAKLKKAQLARQKKRATQLRKAITRFKQMLRAGRKARDKARGAKRAKISERLRGYEDRMIEHQAELKSLGFAIAETELDIGDLAKEAGQVMATPDTGVEAAEVASPSERVGSDMELVDLRERAGLLSAEQASGERQRILQAALNGAYGGLSERERLQLMGDLRDAQQAAVQAQVDNTSALRDLQAEMKRGNDIAQSTVGIGLREAQRALADMISGQLGGRYGARSVLPAGDALARY